MRKYCYVFVLLAALVLAREAFAGGISQSIDPKTQTETWLISVYNNSGSEMDVGDVALWDIGSSTGDNDNYVKSSGSVDTFIVAGVVFPSAIAAGDVGTIIVKGIADVDTVGATVTTGTLLCDSATDGSAQACSDVNSDENSFGFAVETCSGDSCQAYIRAK